MELTDAWNRERGASSLSNEARNLGIQLSEEQIKKLLDFGELVYEGNQRLNLTGKLDWPTLVYKHLLDSLLILPFVDDFSGKVLDLGTGAGFPGVPLAIVQDNWQVTLLDSLRKRIDFLTEATEKLALDLELVWSRAEDFGQKPQTREEYDLVTSRAVAKLPVLLELCLPLVKVGGQLIAYKGPEGEEELASSQKALGILGGELTSVHKLELPQKAGQRRLIVIKKVRPTPSRYPRRAGIPERKPLVENKEGTRG